MNIATANTIVKAEKLKIDDRAPIDLALDANQISCIVGASGSGKTSLLLTLSGVNLPEAGELTIFAQNPHKIDEQEWLDNRLKIAHLLPKQALVSHLTVIQNVMLPLNYHLRLPLDEVEQRALEQLDWLGFDANVNLLPSKINQFQRQIANLARALVLQPSILFIDEAFANFDSLKKIELLKKYKMIQQEKNISVVLATNDLSVAQQCTGQFIFIADTDILSFDNWQSLKTSNHQAVKTLLDSIPTIN